MALIHRLQGLYPCPTCFVLWDEQSDRSAEHPLHMGLNLNISRELRTAADREEHLKDHGLRDVDVR